MPIRDAYACTIEENQPVQSFGQQEGSQRVKRKVVKNFHLDVEMVDALERAARQHRMSAAEYVRRALAASLVEDA